MYGEKVEVPVIDVVIVQDLTAPDQLNAFFCPYCHNPQPLLQFMGRITSITPGHAPIKLPIVKRCVKCKHNYAFNGMA